MGKMDAVPQYRTAIGQDSHRFIEGPDGGKRILLLAGVPISGAPPLAGNSDADVVLHAVTNAVSGITGVNVLGKIADRMCLEERITDSAAYLAEALLHLGAFRVVHLSVSIEAGRPRLSPYIEAMRQKLARLLSLEISEIGLTVTSGEDLTDFGRGLGIQVLCVLTAWRPVNVE
jgi:2-C-methyl-D-erythritol 2,4-cyclodiphosphate synthase